MAHSGSSSAPVESRWSRWGKAAFDKSIVVSDWAAGYANAASAKAGGERFWPKSNDMIEEIDKCTRILRAFTVEGIASQQAEEEAEVVVDSKGNKVKKRRKVLKKIPPRAIKKAKGIVIYSAMRTGIAPFGGAGGTGLVLARLPDGSWSAPASVSPNNLSVGLLLGVDIFDVILLLNSDRAMESFYSHKVTLGAETAVAAGPVGAGTSIESGKERAPVYSYVKSRGFYAGVEAIAQVFLSRFDENERFYYWPGITGEDVLKGKVKIPASVLPLHRALADAESGRAQGDKLERTVYDVVKIPSSDLMARLSRPDSGDVTPDGEEILRDGERLRLPPTPEELDALEAAGIPDEEDLRLAQKDREDVYKLPPPPMHQNVKRYWDQHPNKRALRPTHQLRMSGSSGSSSAPSTLSPWEIPLPPSPREESEGLPPAYIDPQDEGREAKAQYAEDVKDERPLTLLPPPVRGVRRRPVNTSLKYNAGSPSGRNTDKSDVGHAAAPHNPPQGGSRPSDSSTPENDGGAQSLALNVEDESTADAIFQQAIAGQESENEATGSKAKSMDAKTRIVGNTKDAPPAFLGAPSGRAGSIADAWAGSSSLRNQPTGVEAAATAPSSSSESPGAFKIQSPFEQQSQSFDIFNFKTISSCIDYVRHQAFATPVGTAITGAILGSGSLVIYWRYFRRLKSADYITPRELKWRRTLVGKVTSVGDADGFRLYHQPGPPLIRNLLYPVPTTAKALKDQTISVRLAGADAPESAHFGKAEQPFAKEARELLTSLVDGKRVQCEVAHIDQYKRVVATPYVWKFPYIFGPTNVSLALVQAGLATVYRQGGAAYGAAGLFSRILLNDSNGLGRLERAERFAKLRKKGIWSQGRKFISPEEYKKKAKGA